MWEIPEAQYWFTAGNLFSIGSFVFFAVTGIAGLWDMSRRSYVGIAALALALVVGTGLAILGWWQAALQAEATAKPNLDYVYFSVAPGSEIKDGKVMISRISTGIVDKVSICFSKTIDYQKGIYQWCSGHNPVDFDEGRGPFIELPPSDYMIDSTARTTLGKVRERLNIGQKDGHAFVVSAWVRRAITDELICKYPAEPDIKSCF